MNENDNSTEAMIQAAGKTAPRLTPDSIKATIASEHYFTAFDGVRGAMDGEIELIPLNSPLHLLTFCVLVLQNGFTVTGKSSCVSADNFNAEIGRKVARDDAVSQVWPLEGYLLKEKLAFVGIDGRHVQQPVDNMPASMLPPYQQRVVDERTELLERTNKLAAFLVTPTFERLADDEQIRLSDQLEYMVGYDRILSERIAAFQQ